MNYQVRANDKRIRSIGKSFADYCAAVDDEATQALLRADVRQISKDLPRSFENVGLEPAIRNATARYLEAQHHLKRVLLSYVVRHARFELEVPPSVYVQGMNFMAAMLLVRVNFIEEDAFWLLCFILEDILDPAFFSDSPTNFLGYHATAWLLKGLAHKACRWTKWMGPEKFDTVLRMLFEKWLFCVFVNWLPVAVLNDVWGDIVDTGSTRTLFGWTLGLLKYSELTVMEQSPLLNMNEELDVYQAIVRVTTQLDNHDLLRTCVDYATSDLPSMDNLHSKLARGKQYIADDSSSDSNLHTLHTLAKITKFDAVEISQLEAEFGRLTDDNGSRQSAEHVVETGAIRGVTNEQFYDVVREVSPKFPMSIVDKLFKLLDEFGPAGTLTFRELLYGMSILSLGTLDDKFKLAFDLFDTGSRGSLSLKEMQKFCSLLFFLDENDRGGSVSDSEAEPQRSSFSSSFVVAGGLSPRRRKRGARTKKHKSLSRAFLSRLMMAAEGPHTGYRAPRGRPTIIIRYHGFLQVARSEPRLIDVFPWCLPRRPEDVLIRLVPQVPIPVWSTSLWCQALKSVCSVIKKCFRGAFSRS
eukprot:GEMP01025824.1.p1 GENE.GEMP01025824.1~~GEMP01025824.1.p1  ORF type:complete len:583 (+),score=112.59 GEMP01025824.1:86-1834(+)